MAAILGTTGSRNNIDLNLIPMIDLMSCLTAFLMVAAVWLNTAQLDLRANGKALNGDAVIPRVGVLVQADRMWVTVSELGEIVEIPDSAGGHDWTALALALGELARRPEIRLETGPLSNPATDISIAAESSAALPVSYQEMITAVDVAYSAGFRQVGITDVNGLPLRPSQ
jgi:biopolymer transport protein ExbD